MEFYDVLVIGGGIAGSIMAKFTAEHNLKTLFIEKEKTPRNKACSGIQFNYFEKILGSKIPRERLCNHQLNKIRMYYPDGKSFGSGFKMLNFMRKPFDDWLNVIAQQSGAVFYDRCKFLEFEEKNDHVISKLSLQKSETEKTVQVKSRYLIDASGLRPVIRKKIRPQDFSSKSIGSTLNYYVEGSVEMDLNTLYQFWNMDWNDAMFAWVYTKTLDDGKDYWVIGTGCNSGKIKERQESFYDYIQKTFNLKGKIIKKEGFATTIDMNSKDRVWLGRKRILMVGDAAGLVDQVRGVGMDAAALSGRLAAKAIIDSDRKKTSAFDEYKKLMKNVVKQTTDNQNREIGGYKSNAELQKHLDKNMIKMGLGMVFHHFINKFRSPCKQKLLPP
ncbi:MAG: NAD(P)/FAD-dependent oxidoreductase [Candidatus Ranarchaeia archaeon]